MKEVVEDLCVQLGLSHHVSRVYKMYYYMHTVYIHVANIERNLVAYVPLHESSTVTRTVTEYRVPNYYMNVSRVNWRLDLEVPSMCACVFSELISSPWLIIAWRLSLRRSQYVCMHVCMCTNIIFIFHHVYF